MMIFCSGSFILLICVYIRCAELLNLTARLGHSVTLPCQTVERRPFIAVEWTRRDLSPDVVYFHMEKSTFPPDLQNPLFVGRVDLLDGGMKSGNVSINLRNVSISDTGLYECRVQEKRGRPHKRSVIDSEPLIVINLTVEEPDHESITGVSGQNVTLPCRASSSNILAVNWSRNDQGPQYVFFYRDGRPDPGNQDPSFRDRVDLEDSQMKNGSVSVILKNVTSNDTGEYMCLVIETNTTHWETKAIVIMKVADHSDEEKGQLDYGLVVGLSLFILGVIIIIMVIIIIIGVKNKRQTYKKPICSDNESDIESLN